MFFLFCVVYYAIMAARDKINCHVKSDCKVLGRDLVPDKPPQTGLTVNCFNAGLYLTSARYLKSILKRNG